MPRQEKIKFTITQDGMVKEEIQGVYGDACESLTKRVEDALGHVYFTQETADRYVTNEQKGVQRVTLQYYQDSFEEEGDIARSIGAPSVYC